MGCSKEGSRGADGGLLPTALSVQMVSKGLWQVKSSWELAF